ncbi:trp operon leader peptide [Salmonella enterica]|nr:trp operon leader peptide [Salmonella enterica]ECJ5920009.1 trp operon leader peptide [Salmonella enterica subsp. salamae]HCM1883389.1 trp operon leader peptide [Salmonella enterica subsp. salamae serovar 60:z10:z39]EAN4946931.1 trp operon leader peptide [Salmonella enterica]EAX8455595.1 trp operon leader peptide [Salmonella enterica]
MASTFVLHGWWRTS